jgi:MFS family permease
MVLGQVAALASVSLYALAPGPVLLFCGAILEGIARAFFSGNNNALLYDSLKESGREGDYHHFLGKVVSLFQVALALSALAGSALAQSSFRLVLGLSVLPQAAALFVAFRIAEPARSAGAREKSPGFREAGRHFLDSIKLFFSNRRLVAVSSANALSGALGETGFQFSAAFIGALWPVWAIGLSKTLSNAGAALSFRLSGKIIDRFGAFPVLIASRAVGRAVEITASLLPGPASPLLLSSTSLLFGTSVVSAESIVQKEFSDEQRATMGSIGSMMESLLFVAASPLLGLLADGIGPVKAYLWTQVLMIAPAIALWVEMRRVKRGA